GFERNNLYRHSSTSPVITLPIPARKKQHTAQNNNVIKSSNPYYLYNIYRKIHHNLLSLQLLIKIYINHIAMSFVEELRWRGMLQDIMPGTEELLNKEKVSGYIGFDPTGDSLHVGHLTQIMTLIHLQNAGHKPIALVGRATGMIGDPSFKSAERNLLDEETLRYNVECLKKQLSKFLNF